MKRNHVIHVMLTAVLSLIIIAANAQPRSEASAESIARQFMSQKAKARQASQTVKMVRVTDGQMTISELPGEKGTRQGVWGERHGVRCGEHETKGLEQRGFYVFNDEANGGYVVVSGDERQIEVLGYSPDRTFDPEYIPCGLRMMLEQYSREYDYLQAHGDEILEVAEGGEGNKVAEGAEKQGSPRGYPLEEEEKQTRGTRTAIGPLMKTTWSQSPYYNNECPMDPWYNDQCVTGCVATAMAQIMYYHSYPSVGQGQNSYTSQSRKIKESMDFSKVKFDWGNMTTKYDKSSSKASVNAVAALMHACGVAVCMDYGDGASGGSAAYSQDVPFALTNYFKYDRCACFYSKRYFNGEEWEQIIQAELKAGRPMLYSGRTDPDKNGNTSGHAFVLDGMDDSGRYHFNWGWGGSWNDFYALSSMRPGDNTFSNYQTMVCHISPNKVSEHEDLWYAEKFEFDASNRSATISSVYCYSPDATTNIAGFYGSIGWELTNTATGKSEYDYDDISGKKVGSGYKKISKVINPKMFVEGNTYLLYPIVFDKSKKRKTYIRTLGGNTDYYMLQVKNGNIEVTVKGDPTPVATTPNVDIVSVTCDNKNLTKMTKNDILVLHGTYNNTGKTDNVDTRLRIWDENMNALISSKTITKSMPKNSETTVDFEYSLQDLSPGNYIATAQFYRAWGDNPSWIYMKNMLINFTVATEQVTTPILVPVSYGSDNNNLDNLTREDVLTVWTTYKNTGKTGNVKTRLRIWNQDMEAMTVSDVQTVQFKQDTETKVKYNFKLNDLPEGRYIAGIQYLEEWTDGYWYYFKDKLVDFVVKEAQHPEMFWISVTCNNDNLESLTKYDRLTFHGIVENKGKTGDCRTIIMIWNDDTNRKYVSEKVDITYKKDTETPIDMEYFLEDVLPGEYIATLLYEAWWEEGPSNWYYVPSMVKHITVVDAPSAPEITISSVSCQNWFPDFLSQDDVLELRATVLNTGATNNVYTRIRIWDMNMEPVAASNFEIKQFKSGEETIVDMQMPLTNIPVGQYLVTIQYYDRWSDEAYWIYFEDELVIIEVYFEGTDIKGIKPDDETELPIYDLKGQRLNKPRKGLNIIGGKKVYVK